jgi:excisionase family DNA binding protein
LCAAALARQLRTKPPFLDSETVLHSSFVTRLLTVRVSPYHPELTSGEAAELLNVSRPYVVRLLDEGQIPFYRVGTHRRVLLKDVMAYREQHYRARSTVLDQMAAIDQELGLT